MIAASTIDRVRELDIVSVISHYVDLKKSGANFLATSPFTNEKTPSFYVVPSKNIFKCFSSGKGGSAIRFVMERNGMSYPDAVKEIATTHHIAIEYERNGQHTDEYYNEIEQLYKINMAAAKRYSEVLLQPEVNAYHPAFIELINKRRFKAETILQWQIGYAPGDIAEGYTPRKWNFLSKTLIEKGLYAQGLELGLIKTKEDVNYDALRNRLIFPIIDHNDRYVGFGARALNVDKYNAKYLNSSESRIFNKSKIFYGLNFATKAIREKGFAYLMEGYTDVISFHQAGHTQAIGTCGTALTEEQCKLLKRYTDRVVLVRDGDEAGQRATLHDVDLLMAHGFQISVLPMPSIVQRKLTATGTWREKVFISVRNNEGLVCRHNGEDITISTNEIEAVEKIDPDELVRTFLPQREENLCTTT